jgi:radical SAM protein with 4Fe4S-binding SPASM domain
MKNHLRNIPILSDLLRRIHNDIIIKYSLVELISSKAPLSRRLNYLKIKYSAVRGLKRSLGSPILLTIEPTNICNLKCPICETGAGILNRGKKNMTVEEFRYVLDQFDHNLEKMFLYFMGEPFLNRDAYAMIKYASDRGIYVTSCTNGDYVNPRKLVDSGIGEIDFQIAGMSQEVHEIYRIGGNLDKALQNLEETLRIRNSSSGTTNRMTVVAGYILMKHNEHQVDDFIKYCDSIGVDRYNIIGTCLREVSQGEAFLPSDRSYWYYDEEEYQRGNLVPKTRPDNYCGWIYSTATILANGDVVACCRDPQGENVIGNVFQEAFSDIWNNKKYQFIRKRVSTNSDSMKLCSLCPGEEIPPLINYDNYD